MCYTKRLENTILICNLKEMHRAGSSSRSLIDSAQGICSQEPTWSPQVSGLLLPVPRGPLCTDSLTALPALLSLLVFLFVSACRYGMCLIHPFIPSTQHRAWHTEVPECLMKWNTADKLIQMLLSLWGNSSKDLTRYSTLNIKKAKVRNSSSLIKTKRKLWVCLTDCFISSCNGKRRVGK